MIRSVCPFCGLGCTLLLRPGTSSPRHGAEGEPALDFDFEGPVNRGSLCAKGGGALELLTHPMRIAEPVVRDGERLVHASFTAAVARVAKGLDAAVAAGGPAAVGILAGPLLTREEARSAVGLARALGTANLDLEPPEDRGLLAGLALAGADPAPVRSAAEIEAMTAMFVVGDLFTFAPCISKPILAARYDRRQNLLGVLAPAAHRTGWFAKPLLTCRPGREAAALALLLRETGRLPDLDAADLAAVSGVPAGSAAWFLDEMTKRPGSGVFVAPGFGARQADPLVAGLAAMLAGATGSRFLAVPTGANTAGVAAELAAVGLPGPAGRTGGEMFEAALTGELRALLVLGADPVAAAPGSLVRTAAARLDLLAVTAAFPGETTKLAHVVLPAAVFGEKAGTVRNAFGDEVSLERALPPPGAARPDLEILAAIRAALPARPAAALPEPSAPAGTVRFLDELELHFRLARRARGTSDGGRFLVLARPLPPHAGDGSLTRHLSWPRHEFPEPCACLCGNDAKEIGVADGGFVEIGTRDGRATFRVRREERVPPGTIFVPSCHPEVRGLFPWRLDPALRDVTTGPVRANARAAEGGAHA